MEIRYPVRNFYGKKITQIQTAHKIRIDPEQMSCNQSSITCHLNLKIYMYLKNVVTIQDLTVVHNIRALP